MDSRWPPHSSENKHLARETRDFDLNIAENEPLDMSLGFNATANGQSYSNSPQVPILTTQNHYQNADASYSQAKNNFPSSSLLIPGYYDCLNQCFIPSATAVSPPPVNNHSVFGNPLRGRQVEPGSLGQDYYEWQVMQVNNSSIPIRRCANCHTTDTPMWRRGPGGPKVNPLQHEYVLNK
ncbi:hypothetical protein PVL29_007126 [Vitis rotundifolia]|uniref:GATA-type domain-containing protein n=1 Tax=Vitis rotundifolia TaxID=103349 RepID=A0AA39DXS6_VITRO|nr:hypothetical protein PVL29_007126 [Vitis rotundifolia]